MVSVFELVQSDKYLAGGATELEKSFEFPRKRPWTWRITAVTDYIRAVTVTEEDVVNTPCHILERYYLGELVGLTDKISFWGSGELLDNAAVNQSRLSNILATEPRIRAVAEKISHVAGVDAEWLLSKSLGELPYDQLSVAMMTQDLFPEVMFPLVAVILDAYEEGLIPFGLHNARLDYNYDGPETLLCIDPLRLTLSAERAKN